MAVTVFACQSIFGLMSRHFIKNVHCYVKGYINQAQQASTLLPRTSCAVERFDIAVFVVIGLIVPSFGICSTKAHIQQTEWLSGGCFITRPCGLVPKYRFSVFLILADSVLAWCMFPN